MLSRARNRELSAPGEIDLGLPATLDPGLTVKILAALFASGATLALLTVALPHSRRASDLGLLLIVGNAYLVAGALWWRSARMSVRLLPFALAWGSTLITGVAYFSGQRLSPLILFYLWVFIYCAYFFTSVEMVVQISYAGVACAALLLLTRPPGGVLEWWLVTIGTLTVAAVVIRTMRDRVELLIARLYDAARTDPLTMLANRRGFRELLDLELARARRSELPMTVVTGDLDHFKEVNDRSGHQAGDAVLRRVARVLAGGKREIDGVARIGGEEFALVLPDTCAHDALIVAERLRCDLREEFSSDAVPVTISFGIAIFPEHGATAASLVRAADEALYAAKSSGRNRSVLHSPALRNDALLREGELRDIQAERFLAVVLDLAEAVDLRFSGGARHSETVGRYAELMGRALGLSEREIGRVRLAGLLHDIGKVGVPDSILQKPGSLTDEERETIERHPALGAQILDHPSLADIRDWVGAHHERPDGRGYPRGLRGEAIPLQARILAVADAYEAMTSDRAYSAAMDPTAARAELERHARTQFDERVVDALIGVLNREIERAEETLQHV
ncbi:MAG: bifunctional diguanylate cyclase/phosphohydrolase [Solirubrobacteraceae bacterium]